MTDEQILAYGNYFDVEKIGTKNFLAAQLNLVQFAIILLMSPLEKNHSKRRTKLF